MDSWSEGGKSSSFSGPSSCIKSWYRLLKAKTIIQNKGGAGLSLLVLFLEKIITFWIRICRMDIRIAGAINNLILSLYYY
jgi:hypothetical protein